MSRLIRLVLLLASLACLGAWSAKASAAVTWQAAGTAVTGITTTGIGANPAWPAHAQGDIALLFVESTGGQPVTLSVPNGFAAVANSPQATGAGTAGTQLSVFWARATSSAMAAPRIASPSDHFYARIVTFRGVIDNGNPIDATAGGVKAAASTSVTVTGVTTTVANALVVQAVARDNDSAAAAFSAQANVNLAPITEHSDAGTTNGNGGGLGIWSGVKATAGATGNTTATVTSSINAFLTIALKPQPGPRFQAAGAAVQGTGAVSPVWPAHAINDIALLFVESTGGQPATLSTPAGFAAVLNSPQATGAGTAGTRITVFWARATSAAMAAPTVADPGDHVYAQITTYRGVVNAGNPWDVTGGGVKTPASTSVSVTGVTTTVADTLIVQAVARDNDNAAAAFSAQTNVNLTGIAERVDAGTTQGNGGGFAVWDGYKATASATGNTTATVTSSINAFLTIALKPQASSAPVFGAAGAAVITGLNWPTHAIDDVALLFIESTGGQIPTLADAAGFVEVANSPQFTGAALLGTRLTVYWARATSAAMAGPTITGPTDHAYAQIITYRGATNSGNPWDVTGGGVKAVASTSVTVTSVTTTVANTLIVQAVARDNDNAAAAFSAQANVNLTGIAERSDAGTTTGNGGGFAVWDGAKAIAGATGNTTATVTSSINAFLTIALKPPIVAVPDHLEIQHASGTGLTCAASTLTIKACTDAAIPCATPYTLGVSGTLSATGAPTVNWDGTTGGAAGAGFVIPNGSSSVTKNVQVATAGSVVFGITFPIPVPANAAACNFGAPACTFTASIAGFIFSDTTTGNSYTIPAQVSGIATPTLYLRAVQASTTNPAVCTPAIIGQTVDVNMGYACNNPAACQPGNLATVNVTAIASGGTAVSLTFDVNGSAPTTVRYDDVGQITLNASKTVTPFGGGTAITLNGNSNAFVVKPDHFDLSGIQRSSDAFANPAAADAMGAKFVKAGENFTVTVTARNFANAATPNYGQESTAESVKLTPALAAGLGLTNNPAIGGTFGAFSNGVATGTVFTWNEVGIIKLTPSVGDGDYLGAGDTSGTQTGNVGRFYAAKFGLSAGSIVNRADVCPAAAGCPAAFTYMDERMDAEFTLAAQSVGGTTTQNYNYSVTAANNFAKLNPTAAGNPLVFGAVDSTATPAYLTSRLDASLSATGNFVNGNGTANVAAPLAIVRGGAADGPYASLDIGIMPVDGDGALMAAYDLDTDAIAGNDHTKVARTEVRYGRMKIFNALGSELLPLPVALTAQYWNGTAYVTNADDNVTALLVPNIVLGNYQRKTGDTWTTSPALANGTAVQGGWTVSLSKPTATFTGKGSVDLTTNAPGYLPSNTARATFGAYKGSNDFIYLRENY